MSQKDSQKTSIGGHAYEVFKLPPLDAQDVLIDIIQAVAPAAPEVAAIATAPGASGEELVSGQDLSIITKLASGLDKVKMRELIAIMAGVTHCDGAPFGNTYMEVFRGDLPSMYKWLWFCLQVQFGNFSALVQSALSRAARGNEHQGKSPST